MDRNRALLAQAERYVYKTAGQHDLEAYVFRAVEGTHAPAGGRSVIGFFFSSNWDAGLVSQFAPHALYFANRGAVAVLFDYRISSRHQGRPEDAMRDIRSAIRWLRMNAEELGVSPERVIAAGGSAGAHGAVSAALVPGFDDEGDDLSISARPDALVLYSPILTIDGAGRFADKATAKRAMPMRWPARKAPPTLILHGTADRVVPFSASRKFCRKMRWRGNVCQVRPFEGEGHGFFNFNVDARMYEVTTAEADAFLVSQGMLAPSLEDDGTPRLVSWR